MIFASLISLLWGLHTLHYIFNLLSCIRLNKKHNVYIKASTTTLKLMPNFITCLDVILLSNFSIYTWDPHMNSVKKKNGCTNHNVTLNFVVILGMGLGLRCILRLSAQNTQLFSYLNFSSLKLLALTALT